MWSLRGYQLYATQIGLVDGRRDMFELEPADANLPQLFGDRGGRVAGLAAYVEVRYRDHPRVDFYGVGGRAAETRTDYGVAGTSVDLVVQWQRSPALGISGRVGVIDLSLSPGSNDNVPNLPELFLAESTAPGLARQPRYVATGLSASYDRRDRPGAPSTGVFIGGAFRQYSSQDAGTRSFSRAAVDARAFRPVAGERHVVAGRVLLSTDWTTETSPTPFYLQYSLGGSHALRGFPNYRFRGEALLSASVEYRWRAWKFIEVAPFIDAGVVGARLGDLSHGPVHLSPGLGVRVRSDDRVFFRMDWARSADGHRLVLAFSPAF
jgi:outer membrane protein assembly factor BamA